MKIKIIMLVCSLLAFFTINACSIQDPSEVSLEGGESLADKLISASNDPGTLKRSDPDFPATPKESRTLQNGSTMDWSMPSTLTGGGNTPWESRSNAQDEQTAQDAPAEAEAAANEPAAPEVASVGGGWSFELNDDTSRQMVLTLFQNGDTLFGTGSIMEGNDSLLVAASGMVDGQKVFLDVTSIGTISLYRLELALSGDSAAGDYQAFSASGAAWEGNADGFKTI